MEQQRKNFWFSYLETFFRLKENGKFNALIIDRQDELLKDIINDRYEDSDFMKFIFGLIAHFSPERRRLFVGLFLTHNRACENFKKLPLEPNEWSSNGSWVPVLQDRISYLESVLPLLNSVEFLEHKQYVERLIQEFRESMEREKKRDFIDG